MYYIEVDAVLFDLGEVYLMGTIGVEEAIAAEVGTDKADVWRHINGEKLVKLFTGQSSEPEYWRDVIEEGRYPAEAAGMPTAEFLMRAMRDNFREIEGTADIVRDLKKAGYKIGLISDHVRDG